MTKEFLPILYFNMAGEMFYIIEQRLEAQKVDESKQMQVLEDISKAIFNSKLIEEIFRSHTLITFRILRTMFDKLAHSSIMTLNEESMTKLFDLMAMSIKYQVYTCPMPSDLLVITDNHFVSILQTVSRSDDIVQQIQSVRTQFLQYYNTNYNLQSLQLVRYSLLNFFKDINTRITILLRKHLQALDGRFVNNSDKIVVNCECQIPGVIRYFEQESGSILRTETFATDSVYVVDTSPTTLGFNIYLEGDDSPKKTASSDSTEEENQKPVHNNEMELLAMLIRRPEPEAELELKFEFLESNAEEKPEGKSSRRNSKVVEIVSNLSALQRNTELNEIFEDFPDMKVSKKESFGLKDANEEGDKDSGQKSDDDIDYLELIDS